RLPTCRALRLRLRWPLGRSSFRVGCLGWPRLLTFLGLRLRLRWLLGWLSFRVGCLGWPRLLTFLGLRLRLRSLLGWLSFRVGCLGWPRIRTSLVPHRRQRSTPARRRVTSRSLRRREATHLEPDRRNRAAAPCCGEPLGTARAC